MKIVKYKKPKKYSSEVVDLESCLEGFGFKCMFPEKRNEPFLYADQTYLPDFIRIYIFNNYSMELCFGYVDLSLIEAMNEKNLLKVKEKIKKKILPKK